MMLKKIDFGLALQVALELVRMFERMEMETMALLLMFFLMIPFIVGSLWSMGIAVIWQLLCLGVKAGFVLFAVCSFINTIFRFKCGFPWKNLVKGRMGFGAVDNEGREAGSKPKCTLMDIILSVFFQSGLGIPATVWYTVMDILQIGNKKEKLEKKPEPMLIESPSIAELLRVEMSSSIAQFQYGNNKTLPTYSFTEDEEEPFEMNEGPDFAEDINISVDVDGYVDVVLPAARPRRCPRKRIQCAVVPSRKLKKAQTIKL